MAEYSVCPQGTFVLCCGVFRAVLGLHLLISEALGISVGHHTPESRSGNGKLPAIISKPSQVEELRGVFFFFGL